LRPGDTRREFHGKRRNFLCVEPGDDLGVHRERLHEGDQGRPVRQGRDFAFLRSADLEDDICPLDGRGGILRNGCPGLLIGRVQKPGSFASIGLNCNRVA
jgi:hypothetical protein